jgi:hypothetical protein
MVRELPIPNPFPSGKGLLLCDELARPREGWLVVRHVRVRGRFRFWMVR